eukprot:4581621-Prymnesium_polylepis.1
MRVRPDCEELALLAPACGVQGRLGGSGSVCRVIEPSNKCRSASEIASIFRLIKRTGSDPRDVQRTTATPSSLTVVML